MGGIRVDFGAVRGKGVSLGCWMSGRVDKLSGFFNFAEGSYLERTARPVYAVVFLLPFVVFYEIGTLLINTDVLAQSQVRVVAFVWLRDLMRYVGFGSRFSWAAPALVVVVILLALQVTSRKRWQVWIEDLWVMGAECVLLSVPLLVLTLFLNSTGGGQYGRAVDGAGAVVCAAGGEGPLMANIVTGIGAGIYEELLFRLLLIGLLMLFFEDLLLFEKRTALFLSVLASAVLFSAHHHIVFVNGRIGQMSPFNFTEFFFRAVAGVYFAGVFAIRGFGITAGTHVFYDILAVVVNAVFFASR